MSQVNPFGGFTAPASSHDAVGGNVAITESSPVDGQAPGANDPGPQFGQDSSEPSPDSNQNVAQVESSAPTANATDPLYGSEMFSGLDAKVDKVLNLLSPDALA